MELEGTFRRKSYWIFLRMYMKHQFLKSVLILGSVLAFMNCSDENTMTPETDPTAQENPSDVSPTDYAWKLEANGDIYLITRREPSPTQTALSSEPTTRKTEQLSVSTTTRFSKISSRTISK